MTAAHAVRHDYTPASAADRERALKIAVLQHNASDSPMRLQLIEGHFEPMSPTWDHERIVDLIRDRLANKVTELKCVKGSGNLDLRGTDNWYLPDIAIVPRLVAVGAKSLPVEQALLVVEVTSDSNAATDRVLKRRRYGQYGVPLYLLVDREHRGWTLFSAPTKDGYDTQAEGDFGTPVPLPDPFTMDLTTEDF